MPKPVWFTCLMGTKGLGTEAGEDCDAPNPWWRPGSFLSRWTAQASEPGSGGPAWDPLTGEDLSLLASAKGTRSFPAKQKVAKSFAKRWNFTPSR